MQRVHSPPRLPLARVDVLIVELEVWALPRHILFEVTWLCPFDTFGVEVVRTTLYIPKCPVHIRFHLGYVADVQLVVNETPGFIYPCLRLQKQIQWVLIVGRLFLNLFLSVEFPHEYVLAVVLWVIAHSLPFPPKGVLLLRIEV